MDFDAATVMRPKLIRIGDSCYRRLDVEADGIIDDYTLKRDGRTGQLQPAKNVTAKKNNNSKQYNIDELEADDFQDEQTVTTTASDDTDLDWTPNDGEELKSDNRGFALKMHVCSVFYPYIIGKRGQTRSSIEADTRVKLKIPRENENRTGANGNFIYIYGSDRRSVLLAKRRIDTLTTTFRNKQELTHFLAVPIGTNLAVRQRFEEFKSKVLSDVRCSIAKGIDEEVFQFGPRLHLTLRALYLGDTYERKQATKILQSFKEQFLDGLLKGKPKIQLRMKGLDYMNDDPTEVRVLYAKVEEVGGDGLFKQIVNKAFDCFTPLSKGDYGFEDHSEWKVKIHATLLNTRHRDQKQQADELVNGNSQRLKRTTMDVSAIMEQFGDFDFGEMTLDQLHLCTHNSYDASADEYYVTLAKIDL